MNRQDLINRLKEQIVHVEFEKADGNPRLMLATLNQDFISAPISENSDTPKKKNEQVITVWDCEKEDWRAFRLDRLRNFDGNNFPNGITVE